MQLWWLKELSFQKHFSKIPELLKCNFCTISQPGKEIHYLKWVETITSPIFSCVFVNVCKRGILRHKTSIYIPCSFYIVSISPECQSQFLLFFSFCSPPVRYSGSKSPGSTPAANPLDLVRIQCTPTSTILLPHNICLKM